MKLAASNIAWLPHEDDLAAEVLLAVGIRGVEVAPTTVWPNPTDVTEDEALAYRDSWERRGLEVVAFQSLLYGRPELEVFGAPSVRGATLEYLGTLFRLASWLGARRLVFGSPRNRRIMHVPEAQRDGLAATFFRSAAERAQANGAVVCLEPNPAEYHCDWIRSVDEAAAFVRLVGHPALGLQLDAGGIALEGDSPISVAEALRAPGASHVHASEPFLAPLGSRPDSGERHESLARALREAGYAGWVSLEMARRHDVNSLEDLRAATARLALWYAAAE